MMTGIQRRSHRDSDSLDLGSLPGERIPLSLEEGQRIAIEILDEFDAFCKSHGIVYFLVGGGLIGALRHQDLLPWDDDIDVVMKRDDYERFCSEYVDNDRFKLFTYRRVGGYRHGMAKLVRRGTLFIEPTARDTPFGVFVDILPLDAAPSHDCLHARRLFLKVKMYNYAFVISAEATRGSKLKAAIRVVLGATLGRSSYRSYIARLEKQMTQTTGGQLVNYWGAWGTREHASAESFASTVEVMIRGKRYPAPVGYHEWLTNVYGDYMTPPTGHTHYHGHSFLMGEDSRCN